MMTCSRKFIFKLWLFGIFALVFIRDCVAQKNNDHMYYVLLAGGNGERLWPLSNDATPKQLLALGAEETLLDQAIDRIVPLAQKEHIQVSTTERHMEKIRSAVGNKIGGIILEPAARNTAPAILLSCMRIYAEDPDAVIVFLPADAYIPRGDWPAFRESLCQAATYASQSDEIVLLGVRPTHPATGYGYIEYDEKETAHRHAPFKVKHFREKPSLELAQRYIKEGNKLWNICIFVAQAHVFVREYERFAPEISCGVKAYLEGAGSYEDVPKDSIDYAVLEHSKSISVLPTRFSWCDVGNVEVFLTLKDRYGMLSTDLIEVDAMRNLVDVPGRTVALVGVHDLCIVEVEGALLITKRDMAERVRNVVDFLHKRNALPEGID